MVQLRTSKPNVASTGSGTLIAQATGSLSGTGNSNTTAANLTTEGPADWIKWGDANLNRKAGVTALLSTYTKIGAGTANLYSDDLRPLSWTGGTPTATGTNNTTGVYIAGVGSGFSFTAPADTTTRTLTVHVGGWNSTGRLVAHLSDSAAADFVDVTAAATGQYDRNYVLSYKAASAGQTLTVSWTVSAGAGNVTLNGAALNGSGGGTTVAVTGVSVSPTTASVVVAATTQLTATVTPANATNQNVTWSSSNTSVATVNASGLVSGVAPGTATLTVTTQDGGKTATSAITVTTATSGGGGTLSGTGNSNTTAANLTTEGPADWIKWGDANLNRKAGVTALLSTYTKIGAGTANLYSNDLRPLSWTGGTPTATGTNNTTGVYIAGVGSGFSFTAPADTTTRTLTVHVGGWNSTGRLVAHLSDSAAADFVDVTAAATGQYDRNYVLSYKAASAGQTLTVSWTVSAGAGNVSLSGAALNGSGGGTTVAVTGVSVSPTTASVVVAATTQLTATVTPANATNQNVTWSSSNTSVATVNASGLVSGVAPGTATLTVTTQDGGKTATSAITVTTATSGGGGTLSGTGNSNTTAANLTTEGPADWIKWGDANLNRKAGVTALLSTYTKIGAGTANLYSNDLRPLSWTGGTPTATGTNNTTGVYIAGVGSGFSFTAPADTTTRTLTVHVGGWNSTGRLVAHLSDSAAADFVDVTAAATGQYDRNYVLSYKAASAGQTLTVSWTVSAGAGNVSLSGAALNGSGGGTTVAGTWQTLSYTAPILPMHAALLRTGKIFYFCGSGNQPARVDNPYKSVILDVNTGTFTDVKVAGQAAPNDLVPLDATGNPIDIFCAGHSFLTDGRLVIASGTIQYDPFYGTKTTFLLDPTTGQMSRVGDLNFGRWYPTLVTLGDGRVFAVSGFDVNGALVAQPEIYSNATSTWTNYSTATSPFGLYAHLFLMDNSKLFYSGGNAFGDYGVTPRILTLPSQFNQTITETPVPGLQAPASTNQAASLLLPPAQDQKVMIIGGAPTNGVATNRVNIVDLKAANPAYVAAASTTYARLHLSAVILPDRTVFVCNGSTNEEVTANSMLPSEIYNPSTGIWTVTASQQVARVYHSAALLLPDGRVLASGSNPARGNDELRLEIYTPGYYSQSRPVIQAAPQTVAYGGTITIQTPQASSIKWVNLIRPMATTHSCDTEQRLVDIPFTKQAGSLTATVTTNRNLAPPGYYMLSIVDTNNVPSVATWIQLQ